MIDPLISICIPSYERIEFLGRLLESIKIQTFKNFEVIFTDDSKTDSVKAFLQNYKADFPLYYYKNTVSIGTAKNMTEGIKYARAQWIKIIHDDDFFVSENALEQYATAITGDVKYIFSGYNEYYENTGQYINRTASKKRIIALFKTPSIIFAQNILGSPTVLMFHVTIKDFFDINLKWFTDMEYYYRILGKEKIIYIYQPLVNVSYNDTQVTSYIRTNPSVIIPEALYILNKHGVKLISNIIVYDAWWRVFRNMGIRTATDIEQYSNDNPIPSYIKSMLKHQQTVPRKLIKYGAVSKLCMSLSYILNRFN